jgi:hypothetical protein
VSEPAARTAARATALNVLLHAALWLAWAGCLSWSARYVEQSYRDFSPRLPPFTAFLLALAHGLRTWWYVALPLLLGWLALAAAVSYRLRLTEGGRPRARLWSGVMLALPLLAIVCAFFSLWLPLLRVRETAP